MYSAYSTYTQGQMCQVINGRTYGSNGQLLSSAPVISSPSIRFDNGRVTK